MNASIHEVFHPANAVVARKSPFVSARTAIGVFVGGGMFIAGACHLGNVGAVEGVVMYAVIGLPLLIAAIYSRVRQTSQSQERTVSLADGLVTFSTAIEVESCPLQQCCWFQGKVTDDPSLSYQQIRQKAVLLVFRSGRTIACGLTPPFHSQWLNTLRASRSRKVLRQEGALGVLMSVFVIVGFIGGICLGGSAGAALRDALFQRPANNPFANVIPVALSILGAWFGAVIPWFLPGWRRHTDRERQQFNMMAIGLPSKLAIFTGAFAGGNLMAGLILVLFFTALFLVLTRLVCRVPPSI